MIPVYSDHGFYKFMQHSPVLVLAEAMNKQTPSALRNSILQTSVIFPYIVSILNQKVLSFS